MNGRRVLKFELTPQGYSKLEKVYRSSLAHTKTLLKKDTEKIVKTKIVNRAPNRLEEAMLLSIGLITEPFIDRLGRVRGTGRKGSWDTRRFFKIAPQEFLRDAIKKETVRVKREMHLIFVELGKVSSYNIGFSWHGGGMTRSTEDPEASQLWKNLLRAWEFGGTFPNIHARKPGGALEPERGVLAKAMTKTLTPFSMFHGGGRESKPLIRISIMKEMKKRIRQEFGR